MLQNRARRTLQLKSSLCVWIWSFPNDLHQNRGQGVNCPSCGNEAQPGDVYFANCGVKLESGGTAPVAQVAVSNSRALTQVQDGAMAASSVNQVVAEIRTTQHQIVDELLALRVVVEEMLEHQGSDFFVRVNDFQMGFGSMIILIFKWVLASIPALILLGSLALIVAAVLAALGIGLGLLTGIGGLLR
jgi:hypothetical protein